MEPAKLLRRALRRLGGLVFESAAGIDILSPFLLTVANATPEEARDKITNEVSRLFLHCVENADVYHRLQGHKAFYYLIMLEWDAEDPASLLEPHSIKDLTQLFVNARRLYLRSYASGNPPTAVGPKLTNVIDNFLAIIDMVDRTHKPNILPGLNAPPDFSGDRCPWPPDYFGEFDSAMLAEGTTRKAFFGVDHDHKGDYDSIYPHDRNLPSDIRKYLCWLSLTETESNNHRTSLFLSPVAFSDHEQRQEWYSTTGRQSRFYATIGEFLEYAEVAFKKWGHRGKKHVLGLLTPWFFDIEEISAMAVKEKKAVPTVWQRSCFRAGMVILLTNKGKSRGSKGPYRLVIFKPGPPTYVRAAESSSRQDKQNQWVEELKEMVEDKFRLKKIWVGGRAHCHVPAPPERGWPADSVEASCEIIEEIMVNPETIPRGQEVRDERRFVSHG
ncbi:hypothetical protein GGR54DRAFT_605430 [Hypoxylon sp. NC1633]|nr:hypothetical protein GGR54DRAFT_605430 [Hypoxylon sp. NC1633]